MVGLVLSPWPIVNGRKRVVTLAVGCESRRYQARVVFSSPEVRMGWKEDADQAAPVVVRGINQTRGNLPVDVLSPQVQRPIRTTVTVASAMYSSRIRRLISSTGRSLSTMSPVSTDLSTM